MSESQIVVRPDGLIIAKSSKVERVDTQGEKALIKVYRENDSFYYIGTTDRNSYNILSTEEKLENFASGKYIYGGGKISLNKEYTYSEMEGEEKVVKDYLGKELERHKV